EIFRTAVALTSVCFGILAIGIWLAPDSVARALGVISVRAAGTAMLRSDFGGLFAGLAVLCAAAAWTRSRTWILAATAMLTAIITGRTLGWAADGPGGDALEMAVEAGLAALLVAYARTLETPPAAAAARHGRTWRYVSVAALAVVVTGVATLLSPPVAERLFAAAAQKQASLNTGPL